ncbi:Soluble lytic murein transglycosylase [Vibrio stylophorae]|uniref:Soluble lytic murein transglycosylase n=1 Tax=Vibrio stylophorae TaxID=659351 RepID=A0ABM8ZR03_9VIBR|nr:murein transglycosylase [Vibrio stylophorae]CAH0532733.1 Soluble lytic murein transglycosylase [Vibrio stylophorae]
MKVSLPRATIAAAMMWGVAVSSPAQASTTTETPLAKQRIYYIQAKLALDNAQWNTYQHLRQQITEYPLTPYLDYNAFIEQLPNKSLQEVTAFVTQYPDFPLTNTVRARYMQQLAKAGKWADFLTFQPEVPKSQYLQCHYYTAKYHTGDYSAAWQGAKKLWYSGRSVSGACDNLFERWQANGGRSNSQILDRMSLAYAYGNPKLITYLQKQLSSSVKAQGDEIADLYQNPDKAADFSKKSKVTKRNQRLVMAAMKRLTRKDIREAVSQYQRAMDGQHYNKAQRQEMAEFIAMRLVRSSDPALIAWREKVFAKSTHTPVIEQRIRLSMEKADWKGVERWIKKLPKSAQNTPKWTYWRARLAKQKGDHATAKKLLSGIVGQRDFYSAIAAEELGKTITYPTQQAPAKLTFTPETQKVIDRVEELLLVGKLNDAKREWEYLLARSDRQTQLNLAALAGEKEWHHFAIRATIMGRHWDQMSLRFPMAHRWWFTHYSQQQNVPWQTLIALARQESALQFNARSHVGARGLMQLMPATAKATARSIDYDFQGVDTLYNPEVNIRLGSAYLKQMLEKHENNRILAFASYNAGPHRVKQWLGRTQGEIDAVTFIETIPFNETRGYVQNVLMFEVYYRTLLNQPSQLLQPHEMARRY